MRAVVMRATGGADVLETAEIAEPAVAPGSVLVRVALAGVNYFDVQQRRGNIASSLPHVLGREGVGVVESVGDDGLSDLIGSRVAWVSAPGSYAEFVSVPRDRIAIVPDDIDDATACALMLQGLTAHFLANDTVELSPESTALVYAASGGVGRLLLQLARLRGARVIACTSSDAKVRNISHLVQDRIIRYDQEDIAAAVSEITGGCGVDVVYDSVGIRTFEASLASLRPRGVLALYGAASGKVPPFDLQRLSEQSLYVTRPSLQHHVATGDALQRRSDELFALSREGRLETQIHEVYRLAAAADAHRALESGSTMGKLLLDAMRIDAVAS